MSTTMTSSLFSMLQSMSGQPSFAKSFDLFNLKMNINACVSTNNENGRREAREANLGAHCCAPWRFSIFLFRDEKRQDARRRDRELGFLHFGQTFKFCPAGNSILL